MEFDNTTKAKILFGLKLFSELNINGFELKSINMQNKELVFCNSNSNEEKKILIGDLENNSKNEIYEKQNIANNEIMNNEVANNEIINKVEISENENNNKSGEEPMIDVSSTVNIESIAPLMSERKLVEQKKQVEQKGGKSVFKASKYSDTSSNKMSMNGMSKLSLTSSIGLSEMESDSKFNSGLIMNGGYDNKNIFKSQSHKNKNSDGYSETSDIGQIGGNMNSQLISDTLVSISEMKGRKSTSTSKLNLDIFKKNQTGGNKLDSDIKKKMIGAGINSSSTSSICE